MKFKLSDGDCTFSFEGELEEAQALLETYWKPNKSSLPSKLESEDAEPVVEKPQSKPRTQRRRSSGKLTGAAAASAASVSIDAQELANKIKQSEHFDSVKTKILDQKADWIQKCRMTAYFSDVPITSGDVHRLMEAFKIRSQLPKLSSTLSQNSSEFLTSGGNPKKYELTQIATEKFEQWLKATDDA